jgi:iron(III) transport system ATP-binding protein
VDRFVARFLGEGVFLPGRGDGQAVTTTLGPVRVAGDPRPGPCMDVLVRPHDLSLEASAEGNGRGRGSRYEGETRRYAVRLEDGSEVLARVSHELHLEQGEPVRVRISARHPLAVFPAAT